MLTKGLIGGICLLLSISLFLTRVFHPLIWIMGGYYEREYYEKDTGSVNCVCF